MTDEKEGPVHYQVSVTGRQAAAFFLVLLAALGLSFFFGMKTGAAAKRGPDVATALAAQSDIPVPRVPGEGEAVETPIPVPTEVPIGFEPTAGHGGAAHGQPAAKEEAPSRSEPPARQEPKPVVQELAPTAPPKPTAVPAKPAAAPAKPTAAPAKATPPPKAAEKPAPAEEEGTFWVQVLVTKSAEKADGLSKKLKADGFKPDVSLVPGKQGLFRVRVGPYGDRAKAEAGEKKVEKLEQLEATIVPAGK